MNLWNNDTLLEFDKKIWRCFLWISRRPLWKLVIWTTSTHSNNSCVAPSPWTYISLINLITVSNIRHNLLCTSFFLHIICSCPFRICFRYRTMFYRSNALPFSLVFRFFHFFFYSQSFQITFLSKIVKFFLLFLNQRSFKLWYSSPFLASFSNNFFAILNTWIPCHFLSLHHLFQSILQLP